MSHLMNRTWTTAYVHNLVARHDASHVSHLRTTTMSTHERNHADLAAAFHRSLLHRRREPHDLLARSGLAHGAQQLP